MTSLADKYRPTELKDVCGNETFVEIIESTLQKKTIPQTFILKGPRGCGKTTIARIMGRMLNAHGRDLKELNIADMRGIDSARRIIENIGYMPIEGESKVIILNECHMATKEFQNALLERLEEPPEKTYFILCTTNPESLLNTVLSRCAFRRYSVKPLKQSEMTAFIEDILKKEKAKWSTKDIKLIVELSEGIPREALMMMDSLIGLKKKKLSKALKALQETEQEQPIALARALNRGDNWKEISLILKELKPEDAESIRRLILKYMYKVLLDKGDSMSAMIVEFFEDNFYDSGFAGLCLACWKITHYKK